MFWMVLDIGLFLTLYLLFSLGRDPPLCLLGGRSLSLVSVRTRQNNRMGSRGLLLPSWILLTEGVLGGFYSLSPQVFI